MKLSILQAYCLDEMEIECFVSRQSCEAGVDSKPYWVIYEKNQDVNLEQQNQQLLENILNALSWDRQNIQYGDFSKVLDNANEEPTLCGLCFGGDTKLLRERADNNSKIVLLPALELLHGDAALKRETWHKIKQFKV